MSNNPTAFLQWLRETQSEAAGLGAVGSEGDVRLSEAYRLKRSKVLHREFVEKALDAILRVPPTRPKSGEQGDR